VEELGPDEVLDLYIDKKVKKLWWEVRGLGEARDFDEYMDILLDTLPSLNKLGDIESYEKWYLSQEDYKVSLRK
jgi:hypothetical protein